MAEDSPKSIVAERYAVEKEIGRGGMGIVLRAHDKTLDITVAIKLLGKDPTGQGAARLQREATAAGKLHHQNIARIFDFGQTAEGTPFMVMEYLDGLSLSDLIKQKSRLKCRKAVPIFAQIASALNYAHSYKVVHRDLKPSNVMLIDPESNHPQAKLLDFGVAKIINVDQNLTSTGAIVGSPLYMSPEQAQGDEATEKSDIYSFGCLMFETLTGQVPFQGSSAIETISLHRNSAPPLLTDIISVQKLPNEIVTLVDECLRKKPENRPASFESILSSLRSIENKIENRTLTVEQLQKISNQHFKIRLRQFWKSKFGGIALSASLTALIALGVSMFHSEQKRIEETKLTPKVVHNTNPIKEYLDVEVKLTSPFDYIPVKNELLVVATDLANDEAMAELKGKKITKLSLQHGTFNGSGLKYIDPDLTSLTILNVNLRDDNLRLLEGMKSLHLLEVSAKNMTDEDLKHIAKLKTLRELRLTSDLISNQGIEQLKVLPDLDYLVIESSGITDDVISSLLKIKKLRALYLKKTSISANFIQKLAPMRYLQELGITGAKARSTIDFTKLKSLSSLRSLHLSDTTLDENAFICISKMSGMNRLVFGNAFFEPRYLMHLRNMPNLRHLDFWQSRMISDQLIEEILQFKHLEDISFNDSNLTEKQFFKFTRMRTLNSISAQDTQVSQESSKIFMEAFMRIWKKTCLANANKEVDLE